MPLCGVCDVREFERGILVSITRGCRVASNDEPPSDGLPKMWMLQQPGPGTFDYHEVPSPSDCDLATGEVLLKFAAGAICGSDVPKFLGLHDPDSPYTGRPGVPLHEFVGHVEASEAPEFVRGERVVGVIAGSRGLAEYVVNPAHLMFRLDDSLSDVHATVVQPLSTVLSALSRVPDVAGATVAVIGLGPLGLLFTHALKSMGAARVVGVDLVDRTDVGKAFGIDDVVVGESHAWASGLEDAGERPTLVVDAIGHRQEIINDGVRSLRSGGHLLVFGLPEDHYVFAMRSFFRKNLTMTAGATQQWTRFLGAAQRHLLDHPGLVDDYITDVYSITEAAAAFRSYATPTVGRLKIALVP